MAKEIEMRKCLLMQLRITLAKTPLPFDSTVEDNIEVQIAMSQLARLSETASIG